MIKTTFADAKKEVGDLAKDDEDVLLYVMFPTVAEKFLKDREAKKDGLAAQEQDTEETVKVNMVTYEDGHVSCSVAE